MDFTVLLIALGIIIVLFIIGKIFAILTKIFFVILLVAALAVGFFIWQNNNKDLPSTHSAGAVICFYSAHY